MLEIKPNLIKIVKFLNAEQNMMLKNQDNVISDSITGKAIVVQLITNISSCAVAVSFKPIQIVHLNCSATLMNMPKLSGN